jgi:hypothetical protein
MYIHHSPQELRASLLYFPREKNGMLCTYMFSKFILANLRYRTSVRNHVLTHAKHAQGIAFVLGKRSDRSSRTRSDVYVDQE